MKDWPAHMSNLIRRPVIWIRGAVPLNDFLSTDTMFTVPGLRSTFTCPERVPESVGMIPAVSPGVMPAVPMSSTSSARIPQPIWYPASSVPPVSFVLPPPVTLPVNVPSTRYSRDAIDPVSGATGSIDSFCPWTVKVHPSGVFNEPGAADGTGPWGPAGGADASSAACTTGAGGGGCSATASGATPAGASRQTAAKVAERVNMSRWRLSSSEFTWNLQDLSRGILDGPGVHTVNGPPTVHAGYSSRWRAHAIDRLAPSHPLFGIR